MRKFKTVEQLRLHESVSELHKANLAKQEAARRQKAKKARSPQRKIKIRRQHPQQRKPILSEFEFLQPPRKPEWMN